MSRTWKYALAALMVVSLVVVGGIAVRRSLSPQWSKEFRAAYVERTAVNFTMLGMPFESAQKVAVCLAAAVEPKVSQKRMEILRNTDEEPTPKEMELGDAAIKTCMCAELRALGVPCE